MSGAPFKKSFMNTIFSQRGFSHSSLKHCDVVHECSEIFDLSFWPCPYGREELVFEGFIKVAGGIKHLINRYKEISIAQAFSDTLQYGFLSPRPYQLAQSCDGSITECALALFLAFCRSTGHSPDELYGLAYPERETLPCWSEIQIMAEWQGVDYPQQWGEREKAGLLESLHEINNHALAGIVDELGKEIPHEIAA
jgi:hypothetical protein